MLGGSAYQAKHPSSLCLTNGFHWSTLRRVAPRQTIGLFITLPNFVPPWELRVTALYTRNTAMRIPKPLGAFRAPTPQGRGFYSRTSSARASNVGGTVRPISLAALRLMINSYLAGACTGRLAGLVPLRMRSA